MSEQIHSILLCLEGKLFRLLASDLVYEGFEIGAGRGCSDGEALGDAGMTGREGVGVVCVASETCESLRAVKAVSVFASEDLDDIPEERVAAVVPAFVDASTTCQVRLTQQENDEKDDLCRESR